MTARIGQFELPTFSTRFHQHSWYKLASLIEKLSSFHQVTRKDNNTEYTYRMVTIDESGDAASTK